MEQGGEDCDGGRRMRLLLGVERGEWDCCEEQDQRGEYDCFEERRERVKLNKKEG